jgi:ATP-dependent Clp protease, protease subunit
LHMTSETLLDTAVGERRDAVAPSAFAMFSGNLDQEGLSRIFHVVSQLTNDGVRDVHLLLQSAGGIVGNGVCLYNWFRALPLRLSIYNGGSVRSSAVLAYLGATHRRASRRATFTLHPCNISPRAASAGMLTALSRSVWTEAEGHEQILREHLVLTDEEWRAAQETELTLSAERAVAVGLVHELIEFTPPAGARLHAI